MQFLLDQLGGIVVGGILILSIIGLNFQMNNASYEKFGQSTIQQTAISTMETIEYDFYKIGYRVSTEVIQVADSTTTKFKTDLITTTYPEGDGTEDIIEYSIGTEEDLNSTPNPNDKPLYRKVNSGQNELVGTVTEWKINYYDLLGNELAYSSLLDSTGRSAIRAIGLHAKFESPQQFDGRYQQFESDKLITPKNLLMTEN